MDSLLRQGIRSLDRFVQDGRVRIHCPRIQQQVQFTRDLSSSDSFVAYVEAIGELDGTARVLEWKTASACYPEEPAGVTALDPQLICHFSMTGMEDAAHVVFVRKRTGEVKYLRATIPKNSARRFRRWSKTPSERSFQRQACLS